MQMSLSTVTVINSLFILDGEQHINSEHQNYELKPSQYEQCISAGTEAKVRNG
jgi:hypothetical protein